MPILVNFGTFWGASRGCHNLAVLAVHTRVKKYDGLGHGLGFLSGLICFTTNLVNFGWILANSRFLNSRFLNTSLDCSGILFFGVSGMIHLCCYLQPFVVVILLLFDNYFPAP